MVQSVSVVVPSLYTPPPVRAELPLMVQLVSVVVPWLYTPPPSPLAVPPVIVSPENDAVTFASTSNTRFNPLAADRQARRRAGDRLRPGCSARAGRRSG